MASPFVGLTDMNDIYVLSRPISTEAGQMFSTTGGEVSLKKGGAVYARLPKFARAWNKPPESGDQSDVTYLREYSRSAEGVQNSSGLCTIVVAGVGCSHAHAYPHQTKMQRFRGS